MNTALRYLINLCSVLILFEYTLITIHNFTNESPDQESFKLDMISGWESLVKTRLCYLPENLAQDQPSQCVIDWNNWLQIGKNSITGSDFIAQYFLLMTAFYARHFTKVESESLEGLKILPEPVYGDEKDFTGVWRMPSSNNDESSQNEESGE